ncbi:Nucleoside phosphorylase domain [Penicillium roqueforti FM164]|uniref:Nucleoside phosphorylase domain n=1 Tax=Penicillium roqueforti (strain FM164) TaxID=1365484 RepID=W6QPR1_PENRF|nr:Nucleoside phosphorylase domain [Penicillium roqueforti FM164]
MAESSKSQPEQSVLGQNKAGTDTPPCRKRLQHSAYTIGWVCALVKEQTAARAMLDEEHEPLPIPSNDLNTYTLGSIRGHNIVIACLPNMEANSAATVATSMINTFLTIRFGLMVGIGSGIPSKVNLGDVVVSQPVADYSGVVQYDMGRLGRGGQFVHTGLLNRPPNALLKALNRLKSDHEIYGSQINEYLDDVERKYPKLAPKYTRCDENGKSSENEKEKRTEREVRVHYGLIASGNKVVKDAQSRDSLDKAFGGHLLCVEMEAAGLMNDFPCVVIRGICDYADLGKEKGWQEYAATVAAAYAKELLGCLHPSLVDAEDPGKATLENVRQQIERVQQTVMDSGDSDSSSDNDSLFSAPVSVPSTRSFDSGKGEMNSLLIEQFAHLLNEDGDMLSLLLIGLSREPIGFERMRNNFRRLLKHFANDLKADILSESHRDLVRFVSSYSVMITRELFAMVSVDEQRKLNPYERLAHERKVESYLQSLQDAALQTSEVIEGLDPDDEDSDEGSVAEGANEDEPYDGSLQNLDQMKHFIRESAAYQILRRRLEEFVQPSLSSQFRNLVIKWSKPENKNHGDVARYKLRNLVTDLQHVNPSEIRFEHDESSSRFSMFISQYQHLIERWTGESWDWWPLPRYPRPLAESETRLRWKCII